MFIYLTLAANLSKCLGTKKYIKNGNLLITKSNNKQYAFSEVFFLPIMFCAGRYYHKIKLRSIES